VSLAASFAPAATATSVESSVMLAPVSSQKSCGLPLMRIVTTGVPRKLRRIGSTISPFGMSNTGGGTMLSARAQRSTPAASASGLGALSFVAPARSRAIAAQSE
jgi:hypothetical protein